MACLRPRCIPLIRGTDPSFNRPIRESTKRQREPSFYSKLEVPEPIDDGDLQTSSPEDLGVRHFADDESLQRQPSPSFPLGSSSSTGDNNLQNPRPKRVKNNAHPDFVSIQPVEGAADEDEGELGLFLTQSESSDRIPDQAKASDLESANHNRRLVAPVAIMVPPGASSPAEGESSKAKAIAKEEASPHHLEASSDSGLNMLLAGISQRHQVTRAQRYGEFGGNEAETQICHPSLN